MHRFNYTTITNDIWFTIKITYSYEYISTFDIIRIRIGVFIQY